MPGTGIIDDFGQGPLDMPAHLDRWTAAAKQSGIPISFVSVGVSTVENTQSRSRFLRSLTRASYCSFRDHASERNAAKLGYANGSGVLPDLAFSLPVGSRRPLSTPASGATVGVGVMGYYGWNQSLQVGQRIYETYLAKVCIVVQGLLNDGFSIRLLTGDARSDIQAVQDVETRCRTYPGAGERLFAPDINSYRELLVQIGQTDLVVATRFHNVLLSLKLLRPTVSIGYSDKNDALMAEMGLDTYCHQIESFEAQRVLGQIHSLIENPDPRFKQISYQIDDFATKLETQYEALCGLWTR